MTVSTPNLPDVTTQTPSVYKTNIDAVVASLARTGLTFVPHEETVPAMTVRLDAGVIGAVGALPRGVNAQSTGIIAAPSANPRNDIVYIDATTGAVGVATGTEAASPADPTIPSGKIAVARVSITTSTSIITNSIITELRNNGHGTAAQENVAAGGSGDLLRTDGDGSNLSGIISGATDAEKSNIMLNAFRIEVNGGLAVQNMVDGVADTYTDETGIDTANSTNQTYDPVNSLYSNGGATSLISSAAGTAIGDLIASGGLAAAFDGTTVQIDTASAHKGGGTGTGNVGKDWGSGVAKTITKFELFASSNLDLADSTGPTTVSIKLQGSTDNFSSSIVDLYTNATYSSAAAGILTVTSGITTTTAYRYHRVLIEKAGVNITVAEVQLYETSATVDMTLISNATTALSTPTLAFIVIEEENIDAVTLNTDLIPYASRDGGTTWTAGTLAVATSLTSGRILTSTIDISAQPAGTSMKYKIKTLNTKSLKIHSVALQWS